MTDSIAAWVINLIATYPTLIVWILGAYFVASFVVNFLRGAYGKVEALRPGWVNGVLAALDPLAGNFWSLILPKKQP
ncbi:MAG: hypothetical protein IPP07_28805 [Holophagales bacterium]|jgi:hypothetical protein|nr:hypothetical protein [Holophagales bacterium]